jgi:flagellar biosynthesis chaperone FliJ
MKSLLRRRARVVRVRRAQHLQAAAHAAQAEHKVDALRVSAERLAVLRRSLTIAPGVVPAAVLSNAGELAMRLDEARDGLSNAIASARVSADRLASLRIEARIRQESAEKLGEQAMRAFEDWRERRAGTQGRGRGRNRMTGTES